jgi:hypothetical protein
LNGVGTFTAFIVVWIVGYVLDLSSLALEAVSIGALGGFISGVSQWWYLRRKVPHAGWWILVVALCWALLMLVLMIFGYILSDIR